MRSTTSNYVVWQFLGLAGVVVGIVFGFGAFVDSVLGYNPMAWAQNSWQVICGGFAPWGRFWLGVLIAVAVVTASYGLAQRSYNSGAISGLAWLVAVLIVITGFGTSITVVNRRGHDITHDQINKVLNVQENVSSPGYELRDPYDLAYTRLQRSVGDASGYEVPRENVWRFEVDGVNQTCGVRVPNARADRRPVGGIVCVDDAGSVQSKSFTGKVPSWLVTFGEYRLQRVVNDAAPRAKYISSDIYGYIQDGKPYMVVPVTRMQGGSAYHTGLVGDLVFAEDGSYKLERDFSKIPGPAVGESVSNLVLDALNHRGGFMASKRSQFAYDLGGDGANVSQYLLRRSDDRSEKLVTLLTPRGSSETVTAVLEIDPHKVIGGWPAATLYRLNTVNDQGASRASVAEVKDLVNQRYSTAMQLGNSGTGVMEATPADPERLVLTVGSNQRVFARVKVNMLTRETCVFTPAQVQVRCESAQAAPLALGSLPQLFSTEGSPKSQAPSGTTAPAADQDLSGLDDAQLADLLRKLSEEYARRAVAP